jgi:hypothetical protein
MKERVAFDKLDKSNPPLILDPTYHGNKLHEKKQKKTMQFMLETFDGESLELLILITTQINSRGLQHDISYSYFIRRRIAP